MFLQFDGELINTQAISEVIKVEQNGVYKIIIYRTDGSYMAAECFEGVGERNRRFSEIYDMLVAVNLIV